MFAVAEPLECRRLLASSILASAVSQALVASTQATSGVPIDILSTPPTASRNKSGGTATSTSTLSTPIDPGGLWPDGKEQQYQIGNRWSGSTASGSAGSTGTSITLTYSIVPDGTALPSGASGAGEPASNSNLRASLNALYGNMATWLPVIQQVFAEWSAISGITYVYEPNDDGSAITSSGTNPGVLGVRGDVRISGHTIDGASNVLAYDYFPNVSDMVIDTSDLGAGGFMSSTGGNSLRLRNVMTHEHGHGLGFNHVDPTNQTKLMEAFASTAFDGPQFDDTLAVQRNYGDVNEKGSGNNTAANATNRGTLGNGTDTIGTNSFPTSQPTGTVSTSTTNDQDWYKFTIAANKTATITLAPAGPAPYLQGPQGGTTTTFDPKSQSDLELQVVGSDGTTVLQTAAATGVGGSEVINGLALNAGTYYIKVFDQAGSPNLVQAYTVTNTLVAGGVSLTGSEVPVSPDPHTGPVSSIEIDFSEAIDPTSFTTSDISLTREGTAVSLTGATLTSADNVHWFLGSLDTITSFAGAYALSIPGGAVQTPDTRTLSNSISDSWLDDAVVGTSGDDVIRIARAGVINVYFNNDVSPDYSFALTGMPSLFLLGGAGNDTLIVDFTGGAPFPTSGGLTVDGGTHTTSDTLRLIGSSNAEQYTSFASNTINQGTTPSGPMITEANLTALDLSKGQFDLQANLNGLDLNFGAGVNATMESAQTLGALSLQTGSYVLMEQNGSTLLSVTSLALVGTGQLDLNDNDLLINYSGASPLSTVQGWINVARNGGDWSALSGLTSTAAFLNGQHNTTLGAMEASDYAVVHGGTFDGVSPDSTAVLVKYTYYGDANFSGNVDFDDYVRTDSGFNTGLSGWVNGDFNGDGAVNFDDYVLVDLGFNTQGSPLHRAASNPIPTKVLTPAKPLPAKPKLK